MKKTQTLKTGRCVLSLTFLMAALSAGGCQWDSSIYDEWNAALGTNEEDSCANLAYILERNEADKSQVKITCNVGEDGICDSSEIVVSPSTAETIGTADDYRHNFNYNACPNGFECKQDVKSQMAFCETFCGANEHVYYSGCEVDSNDHCGEHGYSCETNVAGWKDGSCIEGKCVASSCDADYKLSNGKCVPSCSPGTHYDSDSEKCEMDSIENCGQKGYNCKDKVAHWATGNCDLSVCKVDSCTENYQVLNNSCVPYCGDTQYYDTDSGKCEQSNRDNCGQKDYACSSVTGWKSGDCYKNKCVPDDCEEGYTLSNGYCISTALTCDMSKQHYYNNSCEDNDTNNCGYHGNVCSSDTIPGWADGQCTEAGKCVAQACTNGYTISEGTCISTATTCKATDHYYDGMCEANSEQNCGFHGVECGKSMIPGWAAGSCNVNTGVCEASACEKGYKLDNTKCISMATTCEATDHYYDGSCEANSDQNCGFHGVKCGAAMIAGWAAGSCNVHTGICEASACEKGYTLIGKTCVSTATRCGNDEHYYDGICEANDTTNCGSHGVACNSLTIPGWSAGKCIEGKCVPSACSSGYSLVGGICISTATTCQDTQHYYNGTCEEDTVDNCGAHDVACNSSTIPGWSTGICSNHKCVAQACTKGYTLDNGTCVSTATTCGATDHYHDGRCEANSDQNCGFHGVTCGKSMIAGWAAGSCNVNTGVCEATDCEIGYKLEGKTCVSTATTCQDTQHYYNGTCEDDTVNNCGSNGNNCADSMIGWSAGECNNGACVASKCIKGYKVNEKGICVSTASTCAADEHYYDYECEANTVENCGVHGNACSIATIPGWADGNCINGVCVPSSCIAGYKKLLNTCQPDCGESQYYDSTTGVCVDSTESNCGVASYDCSKLAGWSNGQCIKNKCVASACGTGYTVTEGVCISTATTCTENQHYYNNKCEDNDETHCGSHDNACNSASIPGWETGSCSDGKCVATSCSGGYTLTKSGSCVATATTCTDNEHYYNGSCEANSDENCGSHGNACSSTSIPGWSAGSCSGGKCVAAACASGYALNESKVCVAEVNYCGAGHVDCTAMAGWVSGVCLSKKSCYAVECDSSSYYYAKDGVCTLCDTSAGFVFDNSTCECDASLGYVAGASGCVCDASLGYVAGASGCECDASSEAASAEGGCAAQ